MNKQLKYNIIANVLWVSTGIMILLIPVKSGVFGFALWALIGFLLIDFFDKISK